MSLLFLDDSMHTNLVINHLSRYASKQANQLHSDLESILNKNNVNEYISFSVSSGSFVSSVHSVFEYIGLACNKEQMRIVNKITQFWLGNGVNRVFSLLMQRLTCFLPKPYRNVFALKGF